MYVNNTCPLPGKSNICYTVMTRPSKANQLSTVCAGGFPLFDFECVFSGNSIHLLLHMIINCFTYCLASTSQQPQSTGDGPADSSGVTTALIPADTDSNTATSEVGVQTVSFKVTCTLPIRTLYMCDKCHCIPGGGGELYAYMYVIAFHCHLQMKVWSNATKIRS